MTATSGWPFFLFASSATWLLLPAAATAKVVSHPLQSPLKRFLQPVHWNSRLVQYIGQIEKSQALFRACRRQHVHGAIHVDAFGAAFCGVIPASLVERLIE